MTPHVISEEYLAEQERLHATENYGVASLSYAEVVQQILEIGRCKSLSDYGAGKCNLRRALGAGAGSVDYRPYDPAFTEYGEPRSADLVACIDVLEHIEPDRLDICLDEIASLTDRLALLTIHTGPAKKVLSDGRNAHLIQEQPDWWLPKLLARFDVIHVQRARKGFFVLACAKGSYDKLSFELDLAALVDATAQAAPQAGKGLPGAKAKIRRAMKHSKLDAGTLWLAAQHRNTPWYVKIIAAITALFALSPVDLTPDFIPVIGYWDDIALLFLGTFLAKRLIPPELWVELRRRAATVDYSRAMRGAVAVLMLMMSGVAMALVHA